MKIVLNPGGSVSMNGGLPPVGALVRRPHNSIRRRIIAGLHSAGFTDLQPGHLAVFQYPGPDGQRPGVLALRADASKQAMNHLLGQLESDGYIVRDLDPADRRTRIVHLTRRGQAAHLVIEGIVEAVETEWRAGLGETTYTALRQSLYALNRYFEANPQHVNNQDT